MSPDAGADPMFVRLRASLERSHYGSDAVCELLGIKSGHSLSERDLPALLSLTAADTALNTLVRLFLIGVPVPIEQVRAASAPMSPEEWAAAGLVAIEGGDVAGRIKLVPFQDLLIAFDLPPWAPGGRHEDYVMGIGSSTLTLANLTIRRPSRLTLDLGTGCGILALLAAGHSERVIATDLNARAVQFAEFNAQLNGLSNIDSRRSDLFAAVADERFDLVVSNPPFVVSPETTYIYRDGGIAGDGLVQRIAREVSAVLAEGGYCQMLCNWAHVVGEGWQDRLARWVEGNGCDCLAIRTDTLDAAGYAAKWICHTERDSPEQYQERLQAWLEYYRQQRIEAISGGLITLRKRSGVRNWFRADEGPEKMLGPAGDDIVAAFARQDFLDATSDEQLLESCLSVPEHLRLTQTLRPAPGHWDQVDSTLYLARGMSYSGRVDAPVLKFLQNCDGRRVVRELLRDISTDLGAEGERSALALVGLLRRLIERGFVIPS